MNLLFAIKSNRDEKVCRETTCDYLLQKETVVKDEKHHHRQNKWQKMLKDLK